MPDINEQLVINGDFATGNLDGWVVFDPAMHLVMEYSPGRHCVVQLPAQQHESLIQYFWAGPGTYQFSLTHRATDAHGRPVDVGTLHAGAITFNDSQGNVHARTLLLISEREWAKTTTEVTVAAGEPPTEIRMSFQNLDNSANAAVARSLGREFIESPFALTRISFWKIR